MIAEGKTRALLCLSHFLYITSSYYFFLSFLHLLSFFIYFFLHYLSICLSLLFSVLVGPVDLFYCLSISCLFFCIFLQFSNVWFLNRLDKIQLPFSAIPALDFLLVLVIFVVFMVNVVKWSVGSFLSPQSLPFVGTWPSATFPKEWSTESPPSLLPETVSPMACVGME